MLYQRRDSCKYERNSCMESDTNFGIRREQVHIYTEIFSVFSTNY